jgi:hypothetical protein
MVDLFEDFEQASTTLNEIGQIYHLLVAIGVSNVYHRSKGEWDERIEDLK